MRSSDRAPNRVHKLDRTDALLAAAREAGVRRYVAQSFASHPKRELSWTLRYPSWREGFMAAYAEC